MDSFEEFHQQLDDAHSEYLTKGGDDSLPLAVRAGRFNQFIISHHPELAEKVTPDVCEIYLANAKKLERATGARSRNELGEQIRDLEITLAFIRFKKESGFRGSDAAEILAFQSFAANRLPELGNVSEEEAKTAIEASRRDKTQRFADLGLASVLISAFLLIGQCRQQRNNPGGAVKPAAIAPADDIERSTKPKAVNWESMFDRGSNPPRKDRQH